LKYFVISDIHGFYEPMITSLNKAKYDQNNPDHHLIVLGDMFDRGPDSDKVLEFIYPLYQSQKATIIIGNHDTFLLEFLQNDFSKVFFNMTYNAFGTTLDALSQLDPLESDLDKAYAKIHARYPFLKDWLASLPYYYELGDYVFVHGGIDGGMLDWKSMMGPKDFIWKREYELPRIPNKIVVAGHTRVATIRKRTHNYNLLFLHNPEYFDILYEEGKILIDRFVEVSQELNVLVLNIKA